jgi:hypothetical protein
MIRKSAQRFSEKIMRNRNLKRDGGSTRSGRALVRVFQAEGFRLLVIGEQLGVATP